MALHEHVVCAHEMKFCRQCDVAFCDKCRVEWRRQYTLQDAFARQQYGLSGALGQAGIAGHTSHS